MKLSDLSVLTPREAQQIHDATVRVLEQTGVSLTNEHGRKLLTKAGATVQGDRVRIPPRLAEQALRTAPKSITVYNRLGKPAMELAGRNCYFGAGGPNPKYCDERTGQHRPFLLADCARLSLVCDACRELSFDMAMAHCTDVPVPVRDLFEVAVMLRHSPKPIIFTANSPQNVDLLAELFRAAAGSAADGGKTCGIFYSEPVSPLTHAPDSLDKVWKAVDAGFPVLYTPAPMTGATGPATLAGNLVVGNAEWLSGLIMIQLHRPGAPVIYGGVFGNLDYGQCIFPYGSAELQLQTIAVADLGRHYGIPSFGTAGCSDASRSDVQSGFEAGLSIYLNLATSANLVHDVGWLASANAASAEQLLLNDAMITHARRLMTGIPVNEETLAVKVINEIGPQGSFLEHDHTLRNYPTEALCTHFWDRRPIGKRLDDQSSFMDKVCDETDQLVRTHRPAPMTAAQTSAVDAILQRAAANAGLAKLPDWKKPVR